MQQLSRPPEDPDAIQDFVLLGKMSEEELTAAAHALLDQVPPGATVVPLAIPADVHESSRHFHDEKVRYIRSYYLPQNEFIGRLDVLYNP